ncbi:MFS transporter [Methylohalobius crimeensis]|uniref:MFS transporter n=1 Tax=Methylohalobius crimeensis TaxID=244365 RepID=UPI000409BDD1|nr:MFS transporter [Methylohalobius crimeensis]
MKTHLKFFLIAMTVVAVMSDSMLVPFYPHFFATVFSITDPRYVGAYIAACCFVVMLAFPFWAKVASKIPPLKLLVYTQFAAGVLSISCYYASTVVEFWLLSLAMLVFKGSYLLIYPFVMSMEDKEKHGGTIGLLSVIVHFGTILGALLGGTVLQLFEPRRVFVVMAAGDFIQMLVCVFLMGHHKAQGQTASTDQDSPNSPESGGKAFIYKLSLIMLVFYFSAFLIRPFFARYWETLSALKSEIVSGLVFAIPAFMALLALWSNRYAGRKIKAFEGVVPALLWGTGGLFLQASDQLAVVLLGRCLFGWALFQSVVRLDLLVFELSTPASYAANFSKIHFFQSLGVLLASFSAGSMVATAGLRVPFITAVTGFVVSAFLYLQLFKRDIKAIKASTQTT